MAAPPAFQFYAKDWQSSTQVLSLAARGAYITLLAWSWENGPLPSDPLKLSRIVGSELQEFSGVWDELLPRWKATTKGFVNNRLERERVKQQQYRELQAEKGRAGAHGRWHATGIAGAMAQAQPKVWPEHGSSSASSSSSLDQKKERAERIALDLDLASIKKDSLGPVPGQGQGRDASLLPSQESKPSDKSKPSERAGSWTRASHVSDPSPNPSAVKKLAYDVAKEHHSEPYTDQMEELKTRLAKTGIVSTPESLGIALAAAIAVVKRENRPQTA